MTATRYRIGLINDYQGVWSYIDYQTWGEPTQAVSQCALRVKGEHRGYQIADDSICVFLNFKQLGEFKDKASAIKLIEKLLLEAPVNLDGFKDYLSLD